MADYLDALASGAKVTPIKKRAVYVEKNWRLTFAFEGSDAVLVNYQDYH